MNPYFSHQQRHIQSNLSTRISNNIAQGSFENMHLNRMKYSNNLSPKGIHFTSINDNMIVQLRDEIRKVTSEKNKLLQENIILKNDFNKIMSNRDSTQYKKKSMPNETIIKSLQDQIQILNDELKHKELIIENNKKFGNEFSKVKDKILKTPINVNVDTEKELVFAKGEIMRLQNEKRALFTKEMCATRTYSDMHRNKGALNAEQSEFLKVLEQFNIDSIAIIEHEGEYNADEIEHRLATLRVILEYIKNTVYTLPWEN
jgi:hypothetical protein